MPTITRIAATDGVSKIVYRYPNESSKSLSDIHLAPMSVR